MITVYTTPICQMCRATKRSLDNAGIEYDTIDATADVNLAEAIRERANELGVMATMPYVTVYNQDNELVADWFGFQPDNIKQHCVGAAA